MRELVGLRSGEGRSGIDAYFDFVASGRRYAAPIELKSTTVGSVSTARDVGPEHIEKWRSRVWLIGFYDSGGATLERMLALGPGEMEPFGRCEGAVQAAVERKGLSVGNGSPERLQPTPDAPGAQAPRSLPQ